MVTFLLAQNAAAQQWTDRVRGSWVDDGKSADGVTLVDAKNVCGIVVADNENSAVKQAAVFLAGDIEKISGQKPRIVSKQTQGKTAIVIFTVPSDDADQQKWPWKFARGDWEAYQIRTTQDAVFLAGSNFRGAAFAAYTLCERLGIDPLYHWTGYQPEHHNPLILKPTDFAVAPPTVRYRGMFHDDEDILPRPFDNNGYPLVTGDVPTEWYAKFFETALRLRMNMVAPYTRVHRRYEVQKMASDWGLFYTSHHYDILLSNPFGIERYGLGKERNLNGPWDWLSNRDGMLRYWQGSLDENKDLNCIWPVGMRGTDDTGYSFPKGTSEVDQANIFKDVIAEQVRMTKASLPKDKQPIFHFTLYTEMLPKYQSGKLDVPDNVIIVWPDDNDGTMRGLPTHPDRWKHGVYYHLAYFGKQVKQSAHMVPPARIAEQFKKIVDSGATEYMLVNVSELREFVMEARMLAEICWDAKTALAGDDPAKRYVKWWSKEYFGESDKPAMASEVSQPSACYEQYYKVLDQYDRLWEGSEKVHDLLGQLSRRFRGLKSTSLSQEQSDALAKEAKACDEAGVAVAMTDESLRGQQQQFFYEHVMLPIILEGLPLESAKLLAKAIEAPDDAACMDLCEQAREPLERMEVAILRAERPPFENWYRETWIRRGPKPWNVHRPFEEIRQFLSTGGKSFEQPDPLAHRRPTTATTKPETR